MHIPPEKLLQIIYIYRQLTSISKTHQIEKLQSLERRPSDKDSIAKYYNCF